jgi:hypothetical protein
MSEYPEIIDSPEDIESNYVGVDILVWDGCDWHIDYVDFCPDTGTYYMANGTEAEAWSPPTRTAERMIYYTTSTRNTFNANPKHQASR